MDTKWKKSKAVCGFLSFALGVSLLLSSLLPIAGNLVSASGRNRLQNAFQSDFQNTAAFRSYLSDTMNSFIAMGAGGPISGGYYISYDYGEPYLIEAEAVAETVMIQHDVGISTYIKPTQKEKDQWKKDAEAWARQFEEDKNILYYITVNNQVAYTNMDRRKDAIPAFPQEGYGFRLSFNGSICEAEKDGKTLDLYGDGIYQEDGKHWALPGYSNYLIAEGASSVRVYLAVADSPQLYVKVDYTSGRSQQWTENRYYHHYQNWLKNRNSLIVNSFLSLAAGLLFLFVWFPRRREKSDVDRVISRFTEHIWFEVKLLFLLGAAVFVLLPMTEEMGYLIREVSYAVTYEETAYYQYPWFLSSYLREILLRPEAVLPAFWICYLFVNDLRYGKKPWRHGLFGMLSAQELKLPVQKRLSRRSALSILVPILALLLFFPVFRFLNTQGVAFYLSFVGVAAAEILLLLVVQCVYAKKNAALARDLGLLADRITAIRDGDLTTPSILPEDSDLRRSAEELSDIQQGMSQAVAEQIRSEQMKVELVTNVSHDLKTPLTSIISYAELLKQESLDPPAGEYVDILCQKAERLRTMVLDVFEVSKAASGELPVKLEELDLAKLLRQTTADMAQVIEDAPVTLRQALPEDPVTIIADGDRLYRVFQNLLQNALSYALEGSRVYLSLEIQGSNAVVSIKNTSKTELPPGVDYTERFVRGDPSRTDGGSGLGLAIADTFTRACGGELTVAPVADLFVVSASFPLSSRIDQGTMEE